MSKVVKKKIIRISLLTIFLVSFIFLTGIRFMQNYKLKNTKIEDLINISKLSSEFMDDYYDGLKEINKEGDYSNILIVVAKKDLKDNYGASKTIKAPNNQYIFKYDNEKTRDNALDKFKSNEDVLSADVNHTYSYDVVNYPLKDSYDSWGIEKMGLDKAMVNMDGKDLNDVSVAIVDSGCNVNLFKKYYGDKLTDTYNVIDNSNDVTDLVGHGTHIAGTIAEGTPSNVEMVSVKISDSNEIQTINMIAGINWVTYNNKADVINISIGGYVREEVIAQAITAATEQNIICVAAAGNENIPYPSYPAALDNTISISSIDSNLNKSEFSNYGSTISFSAPGTDIRSIMSSDTGISIDTGNNDDDDHEIISGTSMATPHAVCAVALLKSFNKNLTFDQTMELLKNRAVDLGNEGWDEIYGYGFINFSNVKFCDGTDCDKYNVLKKDDSVYQKVAIEPGVYESLYNYGNNTNISNIKVRMYYGEDDYIENNLGSLDATIENYNPNIEGEQNITIKYNNATYNKIVNNHLEDGWEITDDGKVKFIYGEDYPLYIEVPEKYNDQTISGIHYSSFENLDRIRAVKLPETITLIEDLAFANCSSLNKINIPNSVIEIKPYAFTGTRNLKNIQLSSNLSKIEEGVFNFTGLTSIDIPSSVKSIENYAFTSSKIEELIIPEGVEEIGLRAFEGNGLRTINLPSTLKKIEKNPFINNMEVEEIIIDPNNQYYESEKDSITIVEKATNTLIMGSSSKSIIPKKVKVLGPYSVIPNLIDNYRIGGFEAPDGIEEIKNEAFSGNYFKDIYLPNSIQKIESVDAFKIMDYSIYDFIYPEYLNLWVYSNSYSHSFAQENNLRYFLIDSTDISVSSKKDSYHAFDKISQDDLEVIVTATGSVDWSDKALQYKIIYNNDNCLKYGDTEITIEVPLTSDYKITKKVPINVEKAIPEYTIPTDIVAESGQKLGDISLPNGFSWMNNDELVIESGSYKAKYTPSDIQNYEIVEDIDIDIFVQGKILIIPEFELTNKEYDGTKNVSPELINIKNLDKNSYAVLSSTTENSQAGKTKIKIRIRLSDDKFLVNKLNNDSQESDYTLDYEIDKKEVSPPNVIGIYNYTGEEQSILFEEYDRKLMAPLVDKVKEIGNHVIAFELKDKNNFVWKNDINTTTMEMLSSKLIVESLIDNIKITKGDEILLTKLVKLNKEEFNDKLKFTLDDELKGISLNNDTLNVSVDCELTSININVSIDSIDINNDGIFEYLEAEPITLNIEFTDKVYYYLDGKEVSEIPNDSNILIDFAAQEQASNNQYYYMTVSIAEENQVYTIGTNDTLTFKSNGPFEKFSGVKIDGVVIDHNYYSIKKGSTILTLNNDFLKTLDEGEHNIKFMYNSDLVETLPVKFKVQKANNINNKPNIDTNPNTNTNITSYHYVLIILLVTSVTYVIYILKKRNYKKPY